MRQKMLAEWQWFILLPLALLLVSIWIGAHAQHFYVRMNDGRLASLDALTVQHVWQGWRGGYIGGYDMALRLLGSTYFAWNAWHFGSQHFGVASLLGWRSGPRWRRKALTIGPTVVIMALPAFLPVFSLLVLNGAMSFLHWTTDIGLSAWMRKASGYVPFVCVILMLGLSGFVFKTVAGDPRSCGSWSVCTAVYSIPVLLALRSGLGFVHFLYSRWVWQRTNIQLMAAA
jgi:hypothetical protein